MREAIAYAIDYKSIIQSVFNGLAAQYVGPIPPGFPYYNESTAGLQPYQYDPVRAAAMYYDYTDVWLYVPYYMTVDASNLSGLILNIDGCTVPSTMFYNTVYYSS